MHLSLQPEPPVVPFIADEPLSRCTSTRAPSGGVHVRWVYASSLTTANGDGTSLHTPLVSKTISRLLILYGCELN